jgi:hypothetical protein
MRTKDITLEYVIECVKKCKTRKEFVTRFERVYTYARKLKILDEVCGHMIVKNYSTPQLILRQITENLFNQTCLYNYRKLITPYELDVYFESLGIAFEYDGERWHKNDTVNKFELCNEKNIILITIKENCRDYETDIKNQLIENLNTINQITNKNISNLDILTFKVDYKSLIPSIEHIIEVCLKYNNIRDFKINEPYYYNLLVRRKLLKEFTKHMSTSRTRYDEMDIKKIIESYSDIGEFLKKESKLYQHIKKNKLDHLIEHLNRSTQLWTRESIIDEINKYEYLYDFKKNTGGCYAAAVRLGLKNELKKLKKKYNTYDIDNLKMTISKYNRLIDFIENDFNTYTYCLNNKLQYLYSHLEKRKKWTTSELITIVNSCNTLKELSKNHPNAYSVIRKRHKYLLENLKKYVK